MWIDENWQTGDYLPNDDNNDKFQRMMNETEDQVMQVLHEENENLKERLKKYENIYAELQNLLKYIWENEDLSKNKNLNVYIKMIWRLLNSDTIQTVSESNSQENNI